MHSQGRSSDENVKDPAIRQRVDGGVFLCVDEPEHEKLPEFRKRQVVIEARLEILKPSRGIVIAMSVVEVYESYH